MSNHTVRLGYVTGKRVSAYQCFGDKFDDIISITLYMVYHKIRSK